MRTRALTVSFLFAIATADVVPAAAETSGPREIRVGYSEGVLTGMDPKDIQVAVELWARELVYGDSLTFSPKIVFFSDTDELAGLIKEMRIDIFSLGTVEYLQTRRRVPAHPALVPVVGEDVFDRYILLVHRLSSVTQVSQLAGKRLLVSMTAFDESVPVLWLESFLHGNGLGPQDDFFSEVRRGENTSQSVISLFFRQVDACLVNERLFDTMTDLNPQLRSDLVVLARSPGFLAAVTCFPEGCDPEIRNLVTENALTRHMHTRGRQILALFGVKGIRPFDPSQLATAVDLIAWSEQSGRGTVGKGLPDVKGDR